MKTTGIWWSEPEGLVQNRTARFSADRRRHLVSLITMLGPSPDWCVGKFFCSRKFLRLTIYPFIVSDVTSLFIPNALVIL